MLWMETYFWFCSVRLGVLVISVFTLISLFIPSMIFFAMGLTVLYPILEPFNQDEYLKKYAALKIMIDKVQNDSNNLMILLQLYFFAHMMASFLAFYGALKIKKYFLLPIIFFEFWRLIFCFAFHVSMMTVCKNRVDLGILITTTVAGGFFILFLGYNWTTCVALYQIINLVNSERYMALYGNDPFKPLIPKTYNPLVTKNVQVLITPTYHDIDEQKKRNNFSKAAGKTYLMQTRPVVSVLAVDYSQNNSRSYRNNLKWKESEWATTTVKTSPIIQELYNRHDNDKEVNYNYWQWSELPSAVSARNKKSLY